MNIPANSRVIICGYTGSGKSCLGQWIAAQQIPHKSHVFISDPTGSWPTWGAEEWYVDRCSEKILDGEKIVRLVSYDPDGVESLCEMASRSPDSLFILDESASFLSRDLFNCWDSFVRLVCHGRKFGQSLISIAQYYVRFPPEFRSQAYVFVSNQAEGRGQDWLKERLRGETPPQIPMFHWFVTSPDGNNEPFTPLSRAEIAPRLITSKDIGTALGTAPPVGMSIRERVSTWIPLGLGGEGTERNGGLDVDPDG